MCRILFVVAFGLLISCGKDSKPKTENSIYCDCLNKYDDQGELHDQKCIELFNEPDRQLGLKVWDAGQESGFIPNFCAYQFVAIRLIEDDAIQDQVYSMAYLGYLETSEGVVKLLSKYQKDVDFAENHCLGYKEFFESI